MKRKYKGVIIFDFDGTIGDSFSVALDIFYSFGWIQPLKREEITRLRGMALLRVARELRVPRYKIPFLLIRGRRAMRKRMSEVKLIPGMDDVIKSLAKQYQLFILSSNSTENVATFMQVHGLSKYFVAIQGEAGLLGKSKKLQRLVVNYQLDRSRTWYVGDESRDVEAAHKTRLKAVSVTWGYNNRKALSRHKPEVIVSSVGELQRCFKNNI